MKSLKKLVYFIFCSFIFHILCLQALAGNQASLGEGIDCTDVTIDYSDNLNLTQEERIRLMDEALTNSLNKFEYCQSVKKNKTATAANGESGQEAGGSSGEGSDGGGQNGLNGATPGGESIASSTMSGTEPASPDPSGAAAATATAATDTQKSGDLQTAQEMDEAVNRTRDNTTGANGKLPEDIPSAENDDVLAAQIRYAAEHETDPEKKKQLWNEYRKYKGLPQKN